MIEKDLFLELKDQAQNQKEAEELFNFGRSLKTTLPPRNLALKLYQFGIISKRLESTNRNGWLSRLLLPFSISLAGLFSVAAVSVFAAQGSLPGDKLYPLKQASEAVLGLVNHQFKDEAPIRRSEEVKALIERNDNSEVKKALQDYQNQVKSLSPSDKKEIIQHSEENLRQAESKATGTTKEEINNILNEDNVKGVEIQNQKTPPQEKPTEEQTPSVKKSEQD